eukprot:625469_1
MSGSKEKMQKQLSASLKRKLNIGELQTKVEGDSSSDTEPAPKRVKELQSESTGPHTEDAETEVPGEGGVAEPDIMEVEHPETPATEETVVVVMEEIKPKTDETKVIVEREIKAEDAHDSAAMFEGELPGKPITTDVFDPRVQRIGLCVSGYPADTKKDDLKQKIEAVTGPCEELKFCEDYVIAYYPCLKEAMVARQKIKELSLTEDGKALTCDYENTGESAMADVEETVEAETTETAEMG